jgi:aldose 1-epimerase
MSFLGKLARVAAFLLDNGTIAESSINTRGATQENMETSHTPSQPAEAGLPSGQQFEIARGPLRAVITEVGACLRSFSLGGQELLDTFGPGEMSSNYRGQSLVPWPGRIEDGEYTFAGTRLKLPLTEPARHNAMHGLACWVNWRPALREANRLMMEVTLHAQPGYPFVLKVQQRFTLSEQGLEVQTTAHNIGTTAAPYGAGHHPYFTVGTTFVNEAILGVPARSYFRANEQRMLPLLPTVGVEGTPFDFRVPHAIGAHVMDTCFTDLLPQDGWTHVTLAAPAGRPSLTVSMDDTHPFLLIFTGDTLVESRRRRGLAIEPYTCAPNAFNNGLGLRVLQPGESFTSVWRVSATI